MNDKHMARARKTLTQLGFIDESDTDFDEDIGSLWKSKLNVVIKALAEVERETLNHCAEICHSTCAWSVKKQILALLGDCCDS